MEAVKIKDKSFWLGIIKSSILAVTISLILILIFALVIRFFDISDKLISPINQAIKILSIFFGCLIGLKSSTKGLIKGIIIGFIYILLSYIIFSILSGTISFGVSSIIDILFACIVGGLSGMLAVNIRK